LIDLHVGKEIATRIVITSWPRIEPTIEEMFLNAEELPIVVSEEEPIVETSSVLAPQLEFR